MGDGVRRRLSGAGIERRVRRGRRSAAVTGGDGGVDDLTGLSGTGRYVRIYGTQRGTEWGYSLWELEVYGTPDFAATRPTSPWHNPVVARIVGLWLGAQYVPAVSPSTAIPSTRWSSAFSDAAVDLRRPADSDTPSNESHALRWETAYGADFQMQVSDDAVDRGGRSAIVTERQRRLTDDLTWCLGNRPVRAGSSARAEARSGATRCWSFEIYGDPAPSASAPDLARSIDRRSRAAYFSSAYAAANAVDGDPSTRWSSQFSDPQWIYVDLGQRFAINEIVAVVGDSVRRRLRDPGF